MSKIVTCSLFLLISLMGRVGLGADVSVTGFVAKKIKPENRFMFMLGQQLRQEKSSNNDYEIDEMKDLVLGFGRGNFNYLLEATTFSQSSEIGVLSVSRKFQEYSVWSQYQVALFNWGVPFVTFGGGMSQELTETKLYSESVLSRGRWQPLVGLGCGFRAPLPWIWVSAEARVVSSEGWNPSTSVYLLGRVGFYF